MHNVVIIGSGPAGYTAALYAARANLKPVQIEGSLPGGQLMITTEVENYPGFPEGILGPELMQLFRQQAEKFGTKFITGNVTKVDFKNRPFKLWIEDEQLIETKTVIIATGASAKLLGLESEKEYMGYGVSACATCDGFFFKGKEIVVVGGGDTAMEEATFLTKFASKVTVIHRRDALRASKIMQDRAFKNPKINFIWDSTVQEVIGNSQDGKRFVTGVKLKNLKTNEITDFKTNGLFIAIGHQPNTEFLKGEVEMNDVGYIKVTKETNTSVAGVFACGDVQDSRYRQAISAAGSGCMAAIDAERFIQEHHD